MKLTTLFVTLLVTAPAAYAQMPQGPREALDGVDPVALLTTGKEVIGKAEFKVTRGKFDYLFATAENKAAFEKTPEKYEIQMNGACARMGGGGTGNPADYAVVDGKIYIFASDDCHKRFVAAPAKFIPKPAPPMPTAPDAVAAGRALLEKAVASLGGADRVDGVTTYADTATQTQTRGDQVATLMQKTTWRLPSADIRIERTMTLGDRTQTTATLLTTDGGWFIGQGRAYPQNPVAQDQIRQAFGQQLIPLLRARGGRAVQIAALSDVVVGGVTVSRVRVKHGPVDVTLQLDKASGQVHSLSFVGRNLNAEIGDYTLVFEDFRDVNGLRLPFAERAVYNGEPDEFLSRTITSIAINGPVDPAVFQPPASGGQ